MRRAVVTTAIFLIAGAAICSADKEVSVRTLLPELTDLGRLAQKPVPAYTEQQASSYDRASIGPDKPNWFANGDAGQFIRVEERDGRKEYVMMDAKGPGAIVRFWSANPAGMVRFYFDGASAPGWECKLDNLLGGRIAPLTDPFAYVASSGWNLYFPIPYRKGLKVTVDEGGRGIYYQIGYRSYAPGTRVRTFNSAELNDIKPLLSATGKQLLAPKNHLKPYLQKSPTKAYTIAAGATKNVGSLKAARGGSRIVLLSMDVTSAKPENRTSATKWADPKAAQNVLRNLILKVSFDGERCIEAPVGDFFGSAPGLNAFKTYPFEVSKTGVMDCRFVMPYRKNAEVTLTNLSRAAATVAVRIDAEPAKFDANTYHFHAQWTAERLRTRPMKDMSFLNVKGEGTWVGVNVHVSNPVGAWWGEGDEKVYVDGEAFPRTFGTGTEDYFGYAWCNPTPFQRPFHAQPRADGPANFGQVSNLRWHVLDCIPYTKAMRFDLELWHWDPSATVTYARTAYWYAKPGGTAPAKIDKTLLAPPFLGPKKVEGAIEGETMKYEATGGSVEVQSGYFDASGSKHLWWKGAEPGQKLTVRFDSPAAGDYEVVVCFAMAGDYGKHRVRLLGAGADDRFKEVDLYSPDLTWKPFTLGSYRLPKGEVELEFESLGHDEKAKPGNMLAIDYVLLKKT